MFGSTATGIGEAAPMCIAGVTGQRQGYTAFIRRAPGINAATAGTITGVAGTGINNEKHYDQLS